jgi:iron(III) transport system substrate-binding protein
MAGTGLAMPVRELLSRRRLLGATAVLAAGPARAATRYEPSRALIDAAKKEGGFVNYTAQIEELEQETVAAFNKRFPFVKVEIMHAPGGQLIERIRAEVATNKLSADLIDHSEPGLLATMNDIFRDYRPPNADDYIASTVVTPRLWPRLTAGWCVAWNTELIKEKPTTWWDLTKPTYAGEIGVPSGYTGGSTWARVMFERKVLGEDYWTKQAAIKPRIYPTNAVTADALVRGEITVAPVSYPAIVPKIRDGAPLGYAFPTEGVPCFIFVTGITAVAKRPAAARLYLDWCLSDEGQSVLIRDLGHLTALKTAPVNPPGLDPTVQKLWFADRAESDRVRVSWLEDWARAYGVRQ